MHGKMHGHGTLTWTLDCSSAAKRYVGQMRQNQKHGFGRLEAEDGSVYEGQWAADRLVEKVIIFSVLNSTQTQGDRKNLPFEDLILSH
jgi:hypothetical protein